MTENSKFNMTGALSFRGKDGVDHDLFAVFAHPDRGTNVDQAVFGNSDLTLGLHLPVKEVHIGLWTTYIKLVGEPGEFNSVGFEFFDEDHRPVNIFETDLNN